MSARPPRAVLFDLDGTLVDSAPDLANAINRVRVDLGRTPMRREDLRPAVSKGGRAMLALAFPDLDEATRDTLLAPFLAYYGQAVAVDSLLFDGVADLLAALERESTPWGIVTNKPIGLAQAVVAGFGWSNRCAVLLGGDSLPRKKPDPDQILLACEQLGVAPGDAVYVGDDERDAVAARAAGMKSVVAVWGYRDAGDDPAAWGGDVLANSARDLLGTDVLWLP